MYNGSLLCSLTSQRIRHWGIDPTCPLAVTDFEGNPVCVTKGKGYGEYGQRNIILWADYRAENEASTIN